jgi:uncharacterized SAM-binding protein YcdF (DUF218 family)
MDSHLHALAETLWRYHQMNQQLKEADAILVLCSHDTRVAETGARLFLEGWAPLLIFSGGLGTITREMWSEPEADQFAQIALDMGVPQERILIENRSTNTGENISFTKILLAAKGLNPERFILVQKPYMERRSFATFRKLWPEKAVIVTSPKVGFDEYLDKYANSGLTAEDVIDIMVGDLQRIKVYSEKGFQIHQEIPEDVWSAYQELLGAGFTSRLIPA